MVESERYRTFANANLMYLSYESIDCMGMELPQKAIKLLRHKLKNKAFDYHLACILYYADPTGELAKSFERQMHCGDFLQMKAERYVSGELSPDGKEFYMPSHLAPMHPCLGRACTSCSRMRTAALMTHYMPRLQECANGEGLYFVTLTMQNVPGESLKAELRRYYELWRKIRHKRQFEKFIKEKGVIGLRKMECTYHGNAFLYKKKTVWVEKWVRGELRRVPVETFGDWVRDEDGCPKPDPWYDTYHPHFHLFCNSKEFAEWLVQQWLELAGDKADAQAQDIREVYDDSQDIPWKERKGKKGCKEIFKYFTKLITKMADGRWWIDAPSLLTILKAVKGCRTFQRFGTDENWRCGELEEDAIMHEFEGLEDLEIEDGTIFEFVESGMWGDGYWEYQEQISRESLVRVERSGALAELLHDSEEINKSNSYNRKDHADREETRDEVEGSVHRLQERLDEGGDCLDPPRAGASGSDARRCEGSTRCGTALGSGLHEEAARQGQARHPVADVRDSQECGGDWSGGPGEKPP